MMTFDTISSALPIFESIVVGAIAVTGFVIRWLNGRRTADLKTINDQRIDDTKIHNGAHALQDARFNAVEQKAVAQASNIVSLSTISNDNAMRVARLEIGFENFEKGQTRIEHSQEIIKAEMKSNFQELAKSIREIRNVPTRPTEN